MFKISELEAELADRTIALTQSIARCTLLEKEIARISAAPPAPASALTAASAFRMPNGPQIAKLYAVVTKRYPQIASKIAATSDTEAETLAAFSAAFHYIGTLHRLPAGVIDTETATEIWINRCQDWACARGQPVRVRTAMLTLATLAGGDVDVCGVDDGTYLYSLGFGVLLGECVDSRPPRCGWLDVIRDR
jgi:hypothetical protein